MLVNINQPYFDHIFGLIFGVGALLDYSKQGSVSGEAVYSALVLMPPGCDPGAWITRLAVLAVSPI